MSQPRSPIIQFDKATLYSHHSFVGYSKTEVRQGRYWYSEYAQYRNAVVVGFLPKRKRQWTNFVETSHASTVILKGWNHPDLSSPYDEDGTARHYAFHRGWNDEFDSFLGKYMESNSIEVIADFRGHDPQERNSSQQQQEEQAPIGNLPKARISVDSELEKERLLEPEPYASPVSDFDSLPVASEGGQKLMTHLVRERNSAFVITKRQQVITATGQLACEVCGLNFKAFYGMLGEGFCEVHHRVPLSEVDSTIETHLEDLAILCSNCHRMIHRVVPFLTVEELKARINKGT